ncbi:MAG TPA: hypothetical protein VFG83_06960 [Kofleriaceae bacterium]|nr:hypothetical protein [Kofleriaceae bacterium]
MTISDRHLLGLASVWSTIAEANAADPHTYVATLLDHLGDLVGCSHGFVIFSRPDPHAAGGHIPKLHIHQFRRRRAQPRHPRLDGQRAVDVGSPRSRAHAANG